MDPRTRSTYTAVPIASGAHYQGPAAVESAYRVGRWTPPATFNPVVPIQERIARRLLPDGFYKLVGTGTGAMHGSIYSLGGPWAELVAQWRTHGRNHVGAVRPGPPDAALAAKKLSAVAVKITPLADAEHELLCMSEDACHMRVSEAAPGTAGAQLCPEFVFGTTIELRDYGTVRVSVMQYMKDFVPIGRAFDSGAFDPEAYDLLERTVRGMWACGVAHCDLHENNVMVRATPGDSKRGRKVEEIIVLDFGHSVLLTPDEIHGLAKAIECQASSDPAADAFDDALLERLRAIHAMRRLQYFHADSRFLRMARIIATEPELVRANGAVAVVEDV
jgi:hypothetical protein